MDLDYHDDICAICLDDATCQEIVGICGECLEAARHLNDVDAHRYLMEYAPHIAMGVAA